MKNQSDISLAQEVARLTSIVGQLQLQMKKFQDSSQYTFSKDVQLLDGRKLILGGTQGNKIGVATSKIGFFGVTPVVKQTASATAASILALLQAYGLSN